ncbi:REP-associated tyrosine transposase [Aequoribacter sp.]|uniref:REP-associated tyrosine transposase n=1 Tax=Aequoribacter sp. TaxID=2847771 RepID=UPI003F69E877
MQLRPRTVANTYYFTIRLRHAHKRYLTDYPDLWFSALSRVQQELPVRVNAFVLLPDHAHVIWTLPTKRGHVERCRRLCEAFSVALADSTGASQRLHKANFRLFRSYYPSTPIHSVAQLQRLRDYLHRDPVRHGLVAAPSEWRYSSGSMVGRLLS